MNGASAVKNFSYGHGGGIYLHRDSDLEMNGGRVSENMTQDYAQGGGIASFYGADSHVLLTGVELSGNVSYHFGGAFSTNAGHSYFDHCSVQDNAAASVVGGILAEKESYILNSTITGNTAWQNWKEAGTNLAQDHILNSNVCNNFYFAYNAQVTTREDGSIHQDAESWEEYHEDEAQRVEPTDTDNPGEIVYVCDHCNGVHHKIPLYLLEVDGNGAAESFNNQTVAEGGTPSDPGTPTRDGYRFDGWVVVNEDGTETPFDPSAPVTSGLKVRAVWTENTSDTPADTPVPAPADTTINDEQVPLSGIFTRGDTIGYLWQQAGEPEWELSDFEDVPEDHEWAVAIGLAQDMGIAVADEEGNFRPDDSVLRSTEDVEGELQEFLNRYAVYAGVELDEGELFIELAGAPDDVIMGEEAQVIFDDFFAKLEAALAEQAA